jgi:hypothetical protein
MPAALAGGASQPVRGMPGAQEERGDSEAGNPDACHWDGNTKKISADSLTEVFRKVCCTTAMSVPLLRYMRSHSCSKEREKPTSPTKAPMAIAMPPKVRSVLRRLRQRFFQAKPAKESWLAMEKEKILKRCETRLAKLKLDKNLLAKLTISCRRQICVARKLCSN